MYISVKVTLDTPELYIGVAEIYRNYFPDILTKPIILLSAILKLFREIISVGSKSHVTPRHTLCE